MDQNETGCQPAPEGPILCVNNCGFFGSASNMNMCSKCYKDLVLNQEQAKSIENIVNGSSSGVRKESSTAVLQTNAKAVVDEPLKDASSSAVAAEPKPKEGPTRCSTCNKRVGLTAFKCRCGNHFCGSHRYSDKHDCPFDYRAAGQDAIAKANPVVKGAKLNNRI